MFQYLYRSQGYRTSQQNQPGARFKSNRTLFDRHLSSGRLVSSLCSLANIINIKMPDELQTTIIYIRVLIEKIICWL